MKILMIAPTPFFSDRGCHTQIYEEIKGLQKIGHEIILCTYGLGRDMPGIKSVRTIKLAWDNKLSAGPSHTKVFLMPFLFFVAIKTILNFKPDVVHAHLHEGAVIARFCQIFFPGEKYLFDMQGSLTGELLQHKFLKKGSLFYGIFKFIESRIVNWFYVITQSDSMVKEAIELGCSKEKITNVKDGVDTNIFQPLPFDKELGDQLGIDKNKPRVLYMGLLEKYQGTDLMFEAFEYVAKECPEVQFIVVGYPNIEKYQSICKELKIESKVKFLGRINYALLPKYLSLSQLAIAPKISPTEGDGKIYNYMAMGMTTIAFDRDVSREILGNTCIYAKFADAKDLGKQIIWAINNTEESVNLGKLARDRAVSNLSWDAVAQRINNVYVNKLCLNDAE